MSIVITKDDNIITVKEVLHMDQRYDTAGDWQFDTDQNLVVTVSKTGSSLTSVLIAVHEIIEAVLCKANGVSEAAVDAWDKDHSASHDPGSIPGCPYYREHMIAEFVEKLLASELQVNWEEHERRIEAL